MKKILVPSIVAFVLTLVTSLFVYLAYWEYTENYQSPIEVRFVTENIIQNSEGYIYEYLFNNDENTLFLHSDEKMSFEEKDFIIFLKNSQNNDENTFIFKYEFDKKIHSYKIAFLVFFIIEVTILVLSVLILLLKVIIKSIKSKQYSLFTKIKNIKEYIIFNYPKYRKITPLLDKLSDLLENLDLFYKNRPDSKDYKIKIRKRVESIVDLYAKNIEIDKKFDSKLIADKVHNDFYENLTQLISYIDSEILNLLKDNNTLISKEFDMLNSEATLSGSALEYLAKKYK